MDTGILIAFVNVAVCSLIVGFCIGVLVEGKSLLKWFNKKLDDIEERYKRKYGEGGDEDGKK